MSSNNVTRLRDLHRSLGGAVAYAGLDLLSHVARVEAEGDILFISWVHDPDTEPLRYREAWEQCTEWIASQQVPLLAAPCVDISKAVYYTEWLCRLGWAWDIDRLLLNHQPQQWQFGRDINNWLVQVRDHPSVSLVAYLEQAERLRSIYVQFWAEMGLRIDSGKVGGTLCCLRQEDDMEDETYVIEDVYCKKETLKALLVIIDEEEYWIPKSQIDDDSEVYAEEDHGELIVSMWIAEQKGWV